MLDLSYTEARRLRPLPAKRVREALVDFESDIESDGAETSLDDSMSHSLLDESLGTRGESYWKQRCLLAEETLKAEKAKHQAEVTRLKAKYDADIAASRDLFLVRTKPTRANGSGQARSYGKELRAIIIDAGPFNTAVSKPISYGQIKLAFNTALESVNQMIAAENAFTEGLSMALDKYPIVEDGALQDHTKQALDRIAEERWCVAPIGMKRQISATTVKALKECKLKLERD